MFSQAASLIRKAGSELKATATGPYAGAMGGAGANVIKERIAAGKSIAGGTIPAIKADLKAGVNLYKDIAMKHSPIGVAVAAKGLMKDRAAAKKSEFDLGNVRAKAAAALAGANRARKQRNAKEVRDLLKSKQIKEINKSNLPDVHKNILFEQDMRRRQDLGLPR